MEITNLRSSPSVISRGEHMTFEVKYRNEDVGYFDCKIALDTNDCNAGTFELSCPLLVDEETVREIAEYVVEQFQLQYVEYSWQGKEGHYDKPRLNSLLDDAIRTQAAIFGSFDTEWSKNTILEEKCSQELKETVKELRLVGKELLQQKEIQKFRHLRKLVNDRLKELHADIEQLKEYIDY